MKNKQRKRYIFINKFISIGQSLCQRFLSVYFKIKVKTIHTPITMLYSNCYAYFYHMTIANYVQSK